MSTVLRDDQQARIDELVRQGAYPDSAAALDDALSIIEQKAQFRALVQEGEDALNRGDVVDHETVFREARKVIADIAAERQLSSKIPG